MDAAGKIKTKDLDAAVAALRSGRCTRLSGWNARWGDAGIARLVDALEAGGGARLTHLFLNSNHVGPAGAARLAGALESGQCPQLARLLLNQIGGAAGGARG